MVSPHLLSIKQYEIMCRYLNKLNKTIPFYNLNLTSYCWLSLILFVKVDRKTKTTIRSELHKRKQCVVEASSAIRVVVLRLSFSSPSPADLIMWAIICWKRGEKVITLFISCSLIDVFSTKLLIRLSSKIIKIHNAISH